MVEKIIINPTKVRAYGNIVNVKSDEDYETVDCTITEDTDTVYGATVNVIVMEPDLGEATTLTVTSSSSTLVLENTVNISATLKDSSNAAISGATITFKEGTTTLGNSTTNSSGIATYTYTGASVGDHTINAGFAGDSTYASSTGNVSVTVNNHSYSLAFSAASYFATGGSATLECTLLDNNVPVEGATISVSGSDSSLYTGITNSNGIFVLYDLTISDTTTFTATYNSTITDTCTVYSCLLVDYATTNKHTDIWGNMDIFTREDDGTSVYYQNTGSSALQRWLASRIDIDGEVAIDLELVDCTLCRFQTGRYATGSNTTYKGLNFTQKGLVHIEIKNNGTYFYFNGNLVQSDTTETNLEQVSLCVYVGANTTANAKYKDLRVYYL